jgi:hypothetical protein
MKGDENPITYSTDVTYELGISVYIICPCV